MGYGTSGACPQLTLIGTQALCCLSSDSFLTARSPGCPILLPEGSSAPLGPHSAAAASAAHVRLSSTELHYM
ncbi:hypothetical protein NDU88_002269 [Pleurodeles waltl]|uniref:Uncharacterized protein n=1 Tax=Pleurodeles waltl TaxID=8319 RepID=A0AAV7ND75_PLEWA|nr:hypothetical protein NDU88_002269 [Pleurodeles waltl]